MAINIHELPAAGALTGAELVEVMQDGVNVQTTAQDIADLAPTPSGLAPAGGTAGQLLAKASNTDYDFEYVDAPTGGGGTTVSAQTADFDADTSGVMYTNTGAGGFITATIQDLSVDSEITIMADATESNGMVVSTVAGISAFISVPGDLPIEINGSAPGFIGVGSSVTIKKISATVWQSTSVCGSAGLI